MAEVDEAAGAFGAAHPEEMACRAGCCDCCGSFFEIDLLEGLFLLRGVATLPPERQGRAVGRALANVQAIGRIRRRKDPYAQSASAFVKDLAPEEAASRVGVYCPLLDDDGCCSVYAWRPVVCRYHGPPRWHAAYPDRQDFCYRNCRGMRARGEEAEASLVLDVPAWRRRLDSLGGEAAQKLFGARDLRFQAPIAEYVVSFGRTLGGWEEKLRPLADPVLLAVRRFFEVLGERGEARRAVQDPFAMERSAAWAEAHLGDPALAADLDRVVNGALDRMSGLPIDGKALAAVLRARGPGFRRHALLVTLQVAGSRE